MGMMIFILVSMLVVSKVLMLVVWLDKYLDVLQFQFSVVWMNLLQLWQKPA